MAGSPRAPRRALMIAEQPAIAFSSAKACPSLAQRAQSRADWAAAGATTSNAPTQISAGAASSHRAGARNTGTICCFRNVLSATIQGPFGDIALAGIEYAVVLFHVIQA